MINSTHRPCLYLSFAFALGIVLGKCIYVSIWIWVLILGVILGVYFWKKYVALLYVLLIILGGMWIAGRSLLPKDSLAFMTYRDMSQCEAIEGVIISSADSVISVNQVMFHDFWQKKSGAVKLRVMGGDNLGLVYGNRVRIKGKLYRIYDTPQGGFSYRRYMQERGIFLMFSPQIKSMEILAENQGNVLIATANHLRAKVTEIFDRYLSPRESSFVSALVIGDRRNMPKDLKEIFVNTGTAHILAISGMNMAVIVSVYFFIFQLTWAKRRWKFIMTAVFLFVYAFISGWSASVVRATIMSAVLLSTFAFEYEGDALNSLGIAAMILMLIDPNNLFDIGFQLSFAAVVGILILTKPIDNHLSFLPKPISTPIAVSIAAFLTTSGIILYHFHMITPISILANIPIVPLADLVMVLGLGLISFSFCPPIAVSFAACLKAILSAMILCAQWFSKVPWGCWNF